MNNNKETRMDMNIGEVAADILMESVAKLNNMSVDEMKKRVLYMGDDMIGIQLDNDSNELKDMTSTGKVTTGIPIEIVAKEFNMTEEEILKYYPRHILKSNVKENKEDIKEKEIDEVKNTNNGMDRDGDIKLGGTLFDIFGGLTKKQLEGFTLPTVDYSTCEHKHLCDPEKRKQCKKNLNNAYGRNASNPKITQDDISEQRKDLFNKSMEQLKRNAEIIYDGHFLNYPTSFIEFEGAYVADPKNPIKDMDKMNNDFHTKLFDSGLPLGTLSVIAPDIIAILQGLESEEDDVEYDVYEEYTNVLENENKDPIFNISAIGKSSELLDKFINKTVMIDESLDIKNILTIFANRYGKSNGMLSYLLKNEIYLYSILVENNELANWKLDLYKDKIVINGDEVITKSNFIKLTIWLNEALERATKICIVIHE